MIYTAISEMHVDDRLRSHTDIFVRTSDTAMLVNGLDCKKPTGIDFKWTIYPMTGYLCGEERSYPKTHEPLPDIYFNFEHWRGIYDDKETQGVAGQKYGINLKDDAGGVIGGTLDITGSPEVARHDREWGWFFPIVDRLLAPGVNGDAIVPAEDIWNHPDVLRRKVSPNAISQELKNTYNVWTKRYSVGGVRKTYYILPPPGMKPGPRIFDDDILSEEKELSPI